LETAVDHAEAVRPDLRAANERVFVQERYKAAKAGEWLPTVDARFTYNWTENTGFQGQNGMWMLVFSANWMIWDGGLRIAQAKEEASKHRQALLAAQKQQQTIEQEVRSAWARLERSQAALTATERELALATENLRLAETALQSGASTWLELEDARLGLLSAQIAGLQERMTHDLARYELLLATGDL
jgi:outer membrane protein